MQNFIKTMVAVGAFPVLGLVAACSGESGTGTGGSTSEGAGGHLTTTASMSTTGTATGGAGTTTTGTGTCPPYMVPTGTNLMAPVVTFKADVMKVFNDNCGSSACHGSVMPTGGVFLGASTAMGSDASQVHAAIVGKAGDELTSMPFVTASDPEKSYLMHKLDGDQCQFDAQCADASCLAEMPSGLGSVLPAETRLIVRRWIAQGAKNN
jgi:hypothetical protein